jgi:hypothetical protein
VVADTGAGTVREAFTRLTGMADSEAA